MRFILGFICVLLCGIINAGTIDPSIPDSKYLQYAKDFNYVVPICGLDKNDIQYCASAVIIGEYTVITAAHVVFEAKSCSVTFDSNKYAINNIICHKDFNDNNFGYHDIAIGHLEQPIKLDFYPELYTEKDEVNKTCCISGYGLTGTFLSGATKSDFKRRAGSNTIDRIERQLLICSPSRRGQKFYTSLEFLIASGDSGGGLFINGKLAGINSCVISDNPPKLKSTYESESGHTRISENIDWIKKNIKVKLD